MAITPLIPEIKALSPTSKLESQLHRPPFSFTPGQILQATVTAEAAPDLFTLQVGGQKIPVETTVSLSTGQNLSVEVTATAPQLQLKMLGQSLMNELDQRIGSSLHTMLQQGETFSELANLTQDGSLSSQLKPSSLHVFQQFQAAFQGNGSEKSGLPAIILHLAASLPTTEITTTSSHNATLANLLQQIQGAPTVPGAIRQEAARLAEFFISTGTNEPHVPNKNQESSSPLPVLLGPGITKEEAIQQLQNLPGSLQSALQPLLAQPNLWTNTNQPLAQVLRFILQTAQTVQTSPPAPPDSQQLQQTLENLGTNMERLLLLGKDQDAANTLKFALLDLAKQSQTTSTRQTVDDALNTIQFSQLVQMRLGAESIFFMPLPFSFLQSGFLLIDHERQKESQEKQQEKRAKGAQTLRLYLQLEGLGNLNIAIQQEGENIALSFTSQDTTRARFLSEHKEELANTLTTGTLSTAQFLVGAKEPVKILLEKMLHAPTGMLNISA